MKFLTNLVIFLVLFAAVAFTLNYLGVVSFNGANDGADTEVIASGEDTTVDVTTEEVVAPAPEPTPEPAAPVGINYPYVTDGATTGEFTSLGNNVNGKEVFSYRVRQGGTIAGVAGRWDTYKTDKGITSTEVTYVDANGAVIATTTQLQPSQVVFLEIPGTVATQPVAATTTVKAGPTPILSASATACTQYKQFFDCVIDKVSGINPEVMKTQLNAFFAELQVLPAAQQNAKCTEIISQIKTSSLSVSQDVCMSILK